MLQTNYGPFDGKSWEDLCQLVFKLKYGCDGYQHMQADPGDFGIEGFTMHTGLGFQCYCPEKHYDSATLYQKQRDKITKDLKKLQAFQGEIAERLGATKIANWIFVSPVIDKNALLKHAQTKQAEVRAWKLPILHNDFFIQVQDADFYLSEITKIRSLSGIAINFEQTVPELVKLDGPPEEYEANIRRKSLLRLDHKKGAAGISKLVDGLTSDTWQNFLSCDGYLRSINATAPMLFARLMQLINEFEYEVRESASTWAGSPNELTEQMREKLAARIRDGLAPDVDETTARKISRLMVARWLAICELDFT